MSGRYWLLISGLWLSFGVLLVGVLRLAVVRGNYYQGLARENKMEESRIPAPRGELLDCKGRVLAKSVYRYFKLDGETKIYESEGSFQGYKFEGKDLSFDLKRQYVYGEALASVTGYVGKAGQDEIRGDWCGAKLAAEGMVGRDGIEASQDCRLRGQDGRRLVEVDARGRYVREMGRVEPTAGESLTLTVDAYWQDKVAKMLSAGRGVVVMSRPKTGEILLMVSAPSFDPNFFSYETDNEKINGYMRDEKGAPLLNRAMAGKYHPGSVFKIAMAVAGLESGVINEKSVFEDIGQIRVGDYSYSNWLWSKRGGTDGMVDIVKAIKRSNDIFFYRLGENLGVERIREWAVKLGLGQKTGIELPGEAAGLVPDEKWKLEARGERWFLGNTYHLAIGQGDVSVTPLQINQMTNIIANNGKMCPVRLIKDNGGGCRDLKIKPRTIELIREGMEAACKSGGTAWPLFNFKTRIACKTGTAEVGDGSSDTHAWLTAFAPADNPEVSITVLIERGGEGSDVAAPIVGDILKEWFGEPETVVPRRLVISN